MIKAKSVSKTRNTIQEVIDQSAVNILACRAAKDEDRAANRAIHAAGGEDRMWQEIANGATTAGLCRQLQISVSSFSRWLERGGSPRQDQYNAAKLMQAQTVAEQALQIAESAKSCSLRVDKLRVDLRKWHASKLDSQTFGKRGSISASLSINDVGLDVLRKRCL